MKPLDHKWGESLAADYVWAEVCGMAPQQAARALLMPVRAYVDDSALDGIHVLGGHVSSAERWAAFSAEWEHLLRGGWGVTQDDGTRLFKWNQMQSPERKARIGVFYSVLEKHVRLSFSVWLRGEDLASVKARLSLPEGPISFGTRPFDVLALGIFIMFRNHIAAIPPEILADLPIVFFFDEQSEKAALLSSWEQMKEAHGEEFRRLYAPTPRFDNDERLVALQAADLWAGQVREWHTAGLMPEALVQPQIGTFTATKGPSEHNKWDYRITEEMIFNLHVAMVRRRVGKGATILDRGIPISSG